MTSNNESPTGDPFLDLFESSGNDSGALDQAAAAHSASRSRGSNAGGPTFDGRAIVPLAGATKLSDGLVSVEDLLQKKLAGAGFWVTLEIEGRHDNAALIRFSYGAKGGGAWDVRQQFGKLFGVHPDRVIVNGVVVAAKKVETEEPTEAEVEESTDTEVEESTDTEVEESTEVEVEIEEVEESTEVEVEIEEVEEEGEGLI